MGWRLAFVASLLLAIIIIPQTVVAFVGAVPPFGHRSLQKQQQQHQHPVIFSNQQLLRLPTARYATDALTVWKEELMSLVQGAPSGRATPKQLTEKILDAVRQLERKCPTPDDKVLPRLAGSWELLWTAQDPESRETNRAFSSWINPLENQSYSNNPEGLGRSNPFLPIGLQNQLEKAGLVSTAAVRSTQAIDLKTGLIRNIVAVNFGLRNRQRRASLTVTVKFSPVLADPRRVNVKFEACRVSVPGTPVDWNFPLGLAGPTGWLRTVYIDDDLRVTRGHKGSVFVLSRPRRASV